MATEYDDIYGGRYLSAANVETDLRLTIGRVETQTFEKPGEKPRKKLVLLFNGEERGLPLNKTNAGILAYTYGKDHHDWVGTSVEVRKELVSFSGKMVEGLRVYPVRPAEKPTAAADRIVPNARAARAEAKQKETPPDDSGSVPFSDEVPF